ncbi:MAG: T9SS type A sorting domain-containing protein [Flavobacteriales bacterium]
MRISDYAALNLIYRCRILLIKQGGLTTSASEEQWSEPIKINSIDKTQFQVALPASGNYSFVFYSITGEEVYSGSFFLSQPSSSIVRWNGEALTSGIYILKITGEQDSATAKVFFD